MNAGCYGGETWRHVARVEVLDRDGAFAMRTPESFRIGYRTVTEHDGAPPQGIFIAAWFRFPEGDARTARETIRALGGRLDVTSAPGQGTTMRIVLPLKDDAAKPSRGTVGV